MKKQTAVEWLVNELEEYHVFHDIKNTAAFQQAKAMEKEQIVDGVFAGYNYDGARLEEHAEQYYTETHGK
jgi:uncharacterized caspase-like protein